MVYDYFNGIAPGPHPNPLPEGVGTSLAPGPWPLAPPALTQASQIAILSPS